MDIAISIFLFRREDYLRKIFIEINNQKLVRDIFCFIDFDENNPEIQAKLSLLVIELCSSNKRLKIITRDKNYGSGGNLNKGLDEVFQTYSRCIVLEDDTIPNQEFFDYSCSVLERYENDQRIGVITGSNYGCRFYPQFSNDIGFSRTMTLWGWAIWKDRWQAYRSIGVETYKSQMLRNSIWINTPIISRPYLSQVFLQHFGNPEAAWDIPLVMYLLLTNRLCVFPSKNLVENAGISDGKGVHPIVPYKKIEAEANFSITKYPEDIFLDSFYEDLLSMFQAKSLGWVNPIGIPVAYHNFWRDL